MPRRVAVKETHMTEHTPATDTVLDRREETVTTQAPGYASTERMTLDVVAEKRLNLFRFNRILWSILGLVEIMLGLRFVLKLLGANPDSGFGTFIYGVTGLLVMPFTGLLPTWESGGAIFETTTLVAMLVFALICWGIVYVDRIASDNPNARTFSRSTRESTVGGSGNERTTTTTTRG